MIEILHHGGFLMWILVGLSIAATGIFLERLYHFQRATINTTEFLRGLRNVLQQGNQTEAVAICDATPGPVARILKAAVQKRDRSRDEIRQAMEDVGLTEVPRLEKHLIGLSTIAQVSPLLGLLGTVLGLINAFSQMEAQGFPQMNHVSGAVWTALLTTAGGLTIAIPATIGYNYLVRRVDRFVLEMERSGVEILNYFAERSEPKAQGGGKP